MKMNCKKCGNKIYELNITELQKLEISGLVRHELKLFAAKKIIDDFGFNPKEAQIILSHINDEYGKCHQCENDGLDSENTECPKCGAFNYNFEESGFTMVFCLHLERALDFNHLGFTEYWCDGVGHSSSVYDLKSLTKESIEKNKSIITEAYIGTNGQGVYEMEIKFGKLAVENYKNGFSLIECIPEREYKDWIKFDHENQRFQIFLK